MKHIQRAYVGLFLGYLFLPLIVLVVFAFNTGDRLIWPPQLLSLRWFGEAFSDRRIVDALANSVVIAIATTILSVVIATMTAYGLARYHFRGKRLLETVNLLAIITYGIVSTVALLLWLTALGISGGVVPTIIGHTTFLFPFGVLIVRDRLLNFDMELELASMDLGATRPRTFFQVTLPLIAPSITAAAILIFLASLGEFLLSFFLIGNTSTLPVFLASQMRFALTPTVNAVATVMVVVPIIGVGVAALFLRREVERSVVL